MAFNLKELRGFDTTVYDFIWLPSPPTLVGDAIRFRQQYYQYYAGGQLRTDFNFGGLSPDIRLTFQGDGGYVEAYNFDHHLRRQGVEIVRQNTEGSVWHIGVTAEILLTEHFTVGIEGEYMQIRTDGIHHATNPPLGIDSTWRRGVAVWSDQTLITGFFRLRY